MKYSSFFVPNLVGLTIQPEFINLVQLQKNKKTGAVKIQVEQALPEKIYRDGKIVHWSLLQKIITNLVNEHKLNGAAAAISLPTNLVRMQYMQMPVGLSLGDIREEIIAQMERDLPGFKDELWLDFVVTEINKEYAHVFFVATKQEYAQHYVECINSTGLRVKILDVDALALKRALTFALHTESSKMESSIVIHYYKSVLSLIVFKKLEVLYKHTWDLATEKDFLPQLKTRLNNVLSVNNIDFQQLILCGEQNENILRLKQELRECLPIEIIDLALTHFPNLIAYGLVLRKVPTWMR